MVLGQPVRVARPLAVSFELELDLILILVVSQPVHVRVRGRPWGLRPLRVGFELEMELELVLIVVLGQPFRVLVRGQFEFELEIGSVSSVPCGLASNSNWKW